MTRINDAWNERVGQGRRVDHWITSGARNDRRSEIRMMFLMTPCGIFKRDKSQRRLVNHKGVDMCINVGWSAVCDEKGVRKREESVPTLTLYRGMNGTLLRRLPYRRWLAKIFIALWTVIGTRYSIPLWKIVSAFTGANPYSFRFPFLFQPPGGDEILWDRIEDIWWVLNLHVISFQKYQSTIFNWV